MLSPYVDPWSGTNGVNALFIKVDFEKGWEAFHYGHALGIGPLFLKAMDMFRIQLDYLPIDANLK